MIALITGATSGFGLATANKFAAQGHDVIINGRRKERLEKTAEEIRNNFKVEVLTLPFDVRDQEAVFSAIGSLKGKWANIDLLVNNAGLALGRDHFDEANIDDWNTMIDTNIKGFLYVAKAVSQIMVIRNAGHIINIGSIAGKEVYEKGNVYCATKSAVDALNRGMRVDLLEHGIKVTAINPGAAETEFSLVRFKGDAATASSVYQGIKALSADDIAEVIYYCASLPAHVCINDLTLTCTQQGSSIHFNRK